MRKANIFISMLITLLFGFVFGSISSKGNIEAARVYKAAAVTTDVDNWHTFLGSDPVDVDSDAGYDTAITSEGYAYAVGQSPEAWGAATIISHSLAMDGFLAKFDSAGTLLRHTFIGGDQSDSARAIAIDANDTIVVVGNSSGGDWGTPPISAALGNSNAFIAKFDKDLERTWLTFLSIDTQTYGYATAVDDAGHIYVGGTSVTNPYLAKFNSQGKFQWQRVITPTGGGDIGDATGIATDQNGDVYLTGYADYGDWHNAGAPVRPHSGERDVFVAKFDGVEGSLEWYTFLGSDATPSIGQAIAVKTTPSPTPTVYVAGRTAANWGTPIQPLIGWRDGFVAQLNGGDGTLMWNTFMGAANGRDEIKAIALGAEGRVYVAGESENTWGRPVIPYPGSAKAAFVAVLSEDGQFLSNTFVGGAPSNDTATGIAVNGEGTVHVVGTSTAAWDSVYWGAPTRPFSGTQDAFVVQLGERAVIRYWICIPLILRQ